MFIAKGQPKWDGDKIVADEKISQNEVVDFVEKSIRLKAQLHWKTNDIRRIEIKSIQNPDYELYLNYLDEGVIMVTFPLNYCEDFFIELDSICRLLDAAIFDTKFNKIPRVKYQDFINKTYSPLEKKKISTISLAGGRTTEWLGIECNSQEELIKFFKLNELTSLSWEKAIEISFSEKLMMTPVLKGWILIAFCGLELMGNIEGIQFGRSRDEHVVDFVNIISSKFGKAAYYLYSGHYGAGEEFYSQNGKLLYGMSWGEDEIDVHGGKDFYKEVFINGEFDFSRFGFCVDIEEFCYLEEIAKPIRIFEKPEFL